jgi:acyl carrier protein
MGLNFENLRDVLVKKHGLTAEALSPDTALFSSRLLDSFAMVELMVTVESQGNFKFRTPDVTLDNLDTIGRILRYAEKRGAIESATT